ncbi:MAG: radical SAM family heme chaperone HemW [Lachnospiraceae bacterium]|nr:radical SAM family heme chaperone HemW [Lachnospiraceae bacterium]
MKSKPLAIYIHIPFCIRKCLYCDFLSFAVGSSPDRGWENRKKEYFKALKREIEHYAEILPEYEIVSVFFGGGTPSVVSERDIADICMALKTAWKFKEDAEVTLEANPGTVNSEKFKVYKDIGINRISFGLQSAHDDELKRLGRIHTFSAFLESYDMARQSGFENINIDLMSGLPGQTVNAWKDTVKKVAVLEPEHISAYGLIIEDGTPFGKMYGEGGQGVTPLPSEEDEREMYHITKSILDQYGYHRYEISNYAKTGYECGHNLVYWHRGDYLGLGLGASSCVSDIRWNNTSVFEKYISPETVDFGAEKETLSDKDQMFETFMLGLRLAEGVDLKGFAEKFDVDPLKKYGSLFKKYEGEGLLELKKGCAILTPKGFDLADHVILGFME